MFKVSNLTGFGANFRTPIALSYIAMGSSGSDTNSYTFGTADIGPEAANRWVIFVVQMNAGSPAGNSPAVTVDGTPATIVHRDSYLTAAFGVFAILKPTGTTASVTINGDSGWDRMSFGVYNAFNLLSLSPYDTLTLPSNATNTLSGDIDVPPGGVIFAVTYAGGAGSHTWTELTENYDGTNERDASGASKAYTTGYGTKTIGVTGASHQPEWLYAVSMR